MKGICDCISFTWWTKRSSPPWSGVMKPNPLVELNLTAQVESALVYKQMFSTEVALVSDLYEVESYTTSQFLWSCCHPWRRSLVVCSYGLVLSREVQVRET